jgi:hypothetical protein
VCGTAVFLIQDMNFVCYTPAVFPPPSGVSKYYYESLKHQTVDFTTSEVHSSSLFIVKVKVKESRNRPGVAQRVPGGLGS